MRTPLLSLALSLAGALTLSACASSSASDAGSTTDGALEIGVGYFKSPTTGPEVVVAGNEDLASEIDGTLKLTPIDSGVAGLAALRGGAFPFVSGVGNPPVVGAIANGTGLKVVFAEYFDAAQLVVPPSVKTDADLAGKTIGALQGSSEDFEIRGWLSTKGLTDKTKVVGFPSAAAIGAAYKAGRIDAAYSDIATTLELKESKGARQVVTAEEIAELGFPSLNVLAVTDEFAEEHPEVVQQVVCQVMRAQVKVAGPEGDRYITNAGKLVGATPDKAIPATKVLPFVPADEQLSWFKDGGPSGDLATGRIAESYALTAQFLKDQGRVPTVPTTEQIVSHLDSSYVEQALEDGCDA